MNYHYRAINMQTKMTILQFCQRCKERNGGSLEALKKMFTVASYMWSLIKEGGVPVFMALLHPGTSINQIYRLGKAPRLALHVFCNQFSQSFPSPDLNLLAELKNRFVPEINFEFLKIKLEATNPDESASDHPSSPFRPLIEGSSSTFSKIHPIPTVIPDDISDTDILPLVLEKPSPPPLEPIIQEPAQDIISEPSGTNPIIPDEPAAGPPPKASTKKGKKRTTPVTSSQTTRSKKAKK